MIEHMLMSPRDIHLLPIILWTYLMDVLNKYKGVCHNLVTKVAIMPVNINNPCNEHIRIIHYVIEYLLNILCFGVSLE